MIQRKKEFTPSEPKNVSPSFKEWSRFIEHPEVIKELYMQTMEADLSICKKVPYFKDILSKGCATDEDVEKIYCRLPKNLSIRREVIKETLNNAVLSYYIDKITVSFLRDKPASLKMFEGVVNKLTDSESRRTRLIGVYRKLLTEFQGDRAIIGKEESTTDIYERHANIEGAHETADGIRRLDDEADKNFEAFGKREWRINHLKLPFADVVFNGGNFHRVEGKLVDLPLEIGGKRGGETFFLPDTHGRYLVSIKVPHLARREGHHLNEWGLYWLRHEMRHVLSAKLFPQLEIIDNETLSGDEALAKGIAQSTAILIDEVRALCLDQSLSTERMRQYIDTHLYGLKSNYANGLSPENAQKIEQFEQQWNGIIAQLKTFDSDNGESAFYTYKYEGGLRLICVALYHFISTAQTVKQLTERLVIATEFLFTHVDEIGENLLS